MKVLVAVKQVVDANVRVRLRPDGSDVDTAGLKLSINPYDENAVEEALRLKEKGLVREVAAVSLGTSAAQDVLRHALAMGADRAVLVETGGVPVQPLAVAKLLKAVVEREQPDMVLLGKQAIDDDASEAGPMLAGLLDWPQGTFISALVVEGREITVTREVDGGTERLALPLPAVVTADLRLNDPRFVKLPNLMMARKKPIQTLPAAELGVDLRPRLVQRGVAEPPPRPPGVKVNSVEELVQKLRTAGVVFAPLPSGEGDGVRAHGSTSHPAFPNPPHPFPLPRGEGEPVKSGSTLSVLVLAEQDGRGLKSSVAHTVTAAQSWGEPVDVLVIGQDTAAVAAQAARFAGVRRVLRSDAAQWTHPLAEDVAALLVSLVREQGYRVLLAAHGSFGKNILPRVCAGLDVAMISDALEIRAPATYVRPLYAGTVQATVESADPIQVVTVRERRFAAVAQTGAAEIVPVAAPPPCSRARWLGDQHAATDKPALDSARVIVSGGRSLGSAAQFAAVLDPLAARLGAAVGATRAAVDAGYAPNEIQVGQTGAIVAPELYIAVGISGAVQHTAGMKESKVIAAINQDPDAPIFNVADYGLVADLFEAVPALVKALKHNG